MSDGINNNIGKFHLNSNREIDGLNTNNADIYRAVKKSNEPDRAEISQVTEKRIENLEKKLDQVQNKQGVLGRLWNNIKNKTKLGANSDKCRQAIEDYKNNKITFEEADNIISKFETKQNNTVNLTANIATGILSVIAVAATAAATGGVSLAAVALGASVGAVTKTGFKFTERATNNIKNDEYDAKQLGKDAASGALGGAVSVATMGIGTAGMTGAEVAKQTLKETVKKGFISGAKAGAIAGGATGAGEYSIEAAFEDDVQFNLGDMAKSAAANAAGGALAGGIMGGVGAGLKHKHVQKLSKRSQELHEIYTEHSPEVKEQIHDTFGELDSKEIITSRVKSKKSIQDKLISKAEKNGLKSTKLRDCQDAIGDGYGTRIQLKSVGEESKGIIEGILKDKNISYEQFIKFMQGDTAQMDKATVEAIKNVQGSVINALKERQTQEIVDKMVKKITDGNLIITELNNYGDDISSYFTEKQLGQISKAYFERTKKPLKIINHKQFESTPNSKLVINPENGVETTTYTSQITTKGAKKASGYASTQMNTLHKFKDGTTGAGELQIRGSTLNKFADCEHIPYDIRKGKITSSDTKYSDIFGIIKGMKDETYKKYNQFIADTYKYLRLKELGIDTPAPDITKIFKPKELPDNAFRILDMNGLLEVHTRNP